MTASAVPACTTPILPVISSVALAVWLARPFTSLATTAKPLPASPARAASIVAFSASRLVCAAMLLISATISPMPVTLPDSFWISSVVRLASSSARLATACERSTWLAISRTEAASSSVAEATVCTFDDVCSAAPATVVACVLVCPAVVSICLDAASSSTAAEVTPCTTDPTCDSKLSAILRSASLRSSAERRFCSSCSACMRALAMMFSLNTCIAWAIWPISSRLSLAGYLD